MTYKLESNGEEWLDDAILYLKNMPEKAMEVRKRALSDLYFFAQLVNPGYMYGSIHRELFYWMQNYNLYDASNDITSNKLIMLPRAHLKSHMVATWCSWIITRHPEVTILYISATSELSQTQLYAVKNILSSKTYRRYFPEYVNPQEGNRDKWNNFKISIDHPKRSKEAIRDATVATAGLTTNTTGWHADIIIADDLVVPENAYTEDGRETVSKKSSQFTSIRNAGGFTMACGTRYHPSDIYATWKKQVYDVYDEAGRVQDTKSVWDIREHVVEDEGVFLWPRSMRNDGKAFGFDHNTLSRIRAEYSDRVQFFAQYYNDPNDPGSERISRDTFQYYNPKLLSKQNGKWSYNGNRLNIYAAIDFAFSLKKGSDYTAIVVIGVDHNKNIFVLDIDRFKTDKIPEYFKHIKELHSKWQFKKLRAEVTVAQQVIVQALKDYVKRDGLTLPIEDYRPSRVEGSKEERIAAALEPIYDDRRVWHCEGGWTELLEEELVKARPAHDDMKDALASAVSIAVAPKQSTFDKVQDFFTQSQTTKSRFGGVPFR